MTNSIKSFLFFAIFNKLYFSMTIDYQKLYLFKFFVVKDISVCLLLNEFVQIIKFSIYF